MSTDSEEDSNTTAVRTEYRFDEARLIGWMSANVDGFRGPLTIEQFAGGQSNPTYKLVSSSGEYVLRRKPPGKLLKGAHAIEREYRIIAALASIGFPVARLFGVCDDWRVIGTPFYVMELVKGRIFWDATFPSVSNLERPAYFDAMNATLAQLHKTDYAAIGLTDFGHPGNFFERQIARWSRQYLEDADAGRDSNMERLVEWLPANIPPDDSTSVVHGDFRCDNMIFHPCEPRVLAVLDWELSTLGHPLSDFTYHTMMYHLSPKIIAGLVGSDLAALNIPSETDYVSAYCRRVGLTSIPHYDFYVAFNMFRLAAIFHGIRGRVIRGNAASEQASARAEAFPALAEAAWRQVTSIRSDYTGTN